MSEQTRGAGQPSWPLSPYQVQVSYAASQNTASQGAPSQSTSSAGIARGTGADWFGPLNPLTPIAPPDIAGRRFDFAPGYNLVTRPRAYEPVGFGELRGFADAYDLLRLVIETRKDQMERQRWRIRPRTPSRSSSVGGAASGTARKNAAIDADMNARIAALEQFFQKPDGVTRWKAWLRSLLEDMFVIDAATLYCQRTRAGQLCALAQLDGSTIKRVIDDWGRTPQPYYDPVSSPAGGGGEGGGMIFPPAYQQVLKGLPAVNYSARDIIYRPRNVRAHRVYGYSPVQQVLMTVNIALRRQLWQLDYFTEGSIPDALIGVPAGWTPDQIKQFQDYWDTEFSGDLAKRRRAKFVPGETAAHVVQTKEPEHKDDFDEWLARIICYAFSVPPQWATKVMNRATADNQSAQAEDEGLEPTKAWVKDLIDEIIAEEFASPDLELAWLDEDEADPKGLEAVLEGRVKLGAVTLNEMRDALGLDPYPNAAADRPMVLTATGYVPIEAGTSPSTPSPAGLTRGAMPPRGATDDRIGPNDSGYGAAAPMLKAAADDPKHPGWPAGAPDSQGGRFRTKDGEAGSASNSGMQARAILIGSATPRVQYAAVESEVKSDATNAPHGVQYAADPSRYSIDPSARTGISQIDDTTEKLLSVLVDASDKLGPLPAVPQLYGIMLHTQFAADVEAANIYGISPEDVERTFPLPTGYPSSKESVRPDVVLRNDSGDIIAIYDVKTGARGIEPWRADELRAATGVDSSVPIIELVLYEES